MPENALQWKQEKIAEQLTKLVRLIPTTPTRIWLSDFVSPEAESNTAVTLMDQRTQALYLWLYDKADVLLNEYGFNSDVERITAAVDIVEIVKKKLAGSE